MKNKSPKDIKPEMLPWTVILSTLVLTLTSAWLVFMSGWESWKAFSGGWTNCAFNHIGAIGHAHDLGKT